MPLDLSNYKARVGEFYTRAFWLSDYKLYFITTHNILPFLVLFFRGHSGLPLALLLFLFSPPQLNWSPQADKINLSNQTQSACRQCKPSIEILSSSSPCPVLAGCALCLFLIQLLLHLAGDVHPTPGPKNTSKITELPIIHINVRSLRNKTGVLACDATNHDIITISETWLSDQVDNDEISVAGFQPPIRRDRPNDPHGGVAVYVKHDLVCRPRPDLSVPRLEAVWVETKLSQETILIGTVYRPPNATVEYWQLIDQSLKKVLNTPHKCIVLGDFNSDFHHNPSPHLLYILFLNNLQQLVTSPTRITETTSSCIDLILTPSKDFIQNTHVLPPICSDHTVPCVKLKNHVKRDPPIKRTILNYSKLDQDKLTVELSKTDWINILLTQPIEAAAQSFSETLMNVVRKCVPSKTITVRQKDAPWFNQTLLKLKQKKDKIHKKAKKIKFGKPMATVSSNSK